MKKSGFTLAEVLITLGIIGVVAALTAPALVSSFQKNKVGPTLKKFVSNMAEANTQLLYDNEAATVTSFAGSDATVYLDELGKYLKGSRDTTTVKSEESSGDEEGKGKTRDLSDYNVYFADSGTDNSLSGPIFLFEDGSAMAITDYTGSVIDFEDTSKGSYKGCIAGIVFDINGFENKPNKWGKDVFQFDLDDNGSILPFGGKAEELAYGEKPIWESDCSEDKLELGRTCSGSVFDNNGKVIYKY